jgi:hypothetical protein
MYLLRWGGRSLYLPVSPRTPKKLLEAPMASARNFGIGFCGELLSHAVREELRAHTPLRLRLQSQEFTALSLP